VSLISQPEALERWQLARQKGLGDPKAEAELYGFFQAFRPDGKGLEDVLASVVGGRELLQRLLKVYRVTAPGWKPEDAYFLVRVPQPLTEVEVFRLAQRHRDSMAQLASFLGVDELRALLGTAREISFVPTMESTALAAGANLQIYEAAVEFMTALPVQESEALLLGEAYYGIACDYFLKYYLLWPLYRQASSVDEPFDAYFQLWKHGFQCDFGTRGIVSLSGPATSLRVVK